MFNCLLIDLCLTQCVLCLNDRASIESNQCSDRYFYEKNSEKNEASRNGFDQYELMICIDDRRQSALNHFFFLQSFDNVQELKSIVVKHTLTVGKGSWIGMWAKNRLLDWFDSKGS